MTALITEKLDGHVLILTMNRPEKKNALTAEMYLGLAKGLRRSEKDEKIRVVVVTGSDHCFTSGNDVSDLLNKPSGDDPAGADRPFAQFIRALTATPKPIIAAVDGLAIGVGTTMLLHFDLIYASSDVRFSLPFTNLGLVPEAASSALLPQLIGHQRASELFLLGEPFDSETALNIGIVNQIFPSETLLEETLKIAQKLAAKPPQSVQRSKALIKKGRPDVHKIIAEELVIFTEQQNTPEAKEALSAFLERRPADFSKF